LKINSKITFQRESFTGRLQQNNNAAINANCGDSTGSVRNSVQVY